MTEALDAVRQEAAYYQAVEEYFVTRRAESLTISNADWTLIRRWRKASVPLRVVLRGIADAFDAHAHSWSRGRAVGSLRYCETQVDEAYERWERALAGGDSSAEPLDVCTRLRGALEHAAEHLQGALRECVAAILVEWASEVPHAGAALESWLREREERLLREVRAALGTDRLAQVTEEIETDLRPYRERLPERVLQQVREESQRRRLLEIAGLPRLTLFEV